MKLRRVFFMPLALILGVTACDADLDEAEVAELAADVGMDLDALLDSMEEIDEDEVAAAGATDITATPDSQSATYYRYFNIGATCKGLSSTQATQVCRLKGFLGGWVVWQSTCNNNYRTVTVKCYDKT